MMFPFGKPRCIDQSSLIPPENLHMDQDISILTKRIMTGRTIWKKKKNRVSDVKKYKPSNDMKTTNQDLNSKVGGKLVYRFVKWLHITWGELQLEPVGGTTIPETREVLLHDFKHCCNFLMCRIASPTFSPNLYFIYFCMCSRNLQSMMSVCPPQQTPFS